MSGRPSVTTDEIKCMLIGIERLLNNTQKCQVLFLENSCGKIIRNCACVWCQNADDHKISRCGKSIMKIKVIAL